MLKNRARTFRAIVTLGRLGIWKSQGLGNISYVCIRESRL